MTIEELQTSNEEHKASAEEVMSINEELQSTNEELETSKEEMQSLNEELGEFRPMTPHTFGRNDDLEVEAPRIDRRQRDASMHVDAAQNDRADPTIA